MKKQEVEIVEFFNVGGPLMILGSKREFHPEIGDWLVSLENIPEWIITGVVIHSKPLPNSVMLKPLYYKDCQVKPIGKNASLKIGKKYYLLKQNQLP